MIINTDHVPAIFRTDPARRACAMLLAELENLDSITIDEKKTSLHVVFNGAGFLGVHPRKDGIRINLVQDYCPDSPRIQKSEQLSRARFHNEVDLTSEARIDDELIGWIKEAYELQAEMQ
ncbi:MAG: DUF5655 domain-containing protein [Armatimonadota bacterium]